MSDTNLQKKKCVLVVDDDVDSLEVMTVFLEQEGGFIVRGVATGPIALAVLEIWKPNCIIMDMVMPHMDGRTLHRHIRTHPNYHRIPIIINSAMDCTKDEWDRLTRVLLKPGSIPQLIKQISLLTDLPE